MPLKTKILIARVVLIILCISVFTLVITTFDNPDTSKLTSMLLMICVLLMLYHNSLPRR
jgi:hypothetical protein